MSSNMMENDDEITGINVTPLVDITLVLLIIFMVTANYIVSQSISVQLPKAAATEAVTKQSLTFALDKDSQLYFGGKVIQLTDVPKIIEESKKDGAKVQALIAADQVVPHGMVVKLIDIVRKSGVTDFAINVDTAQ